MRILLFMLLLVSCSTTTSNSPLSGRVAILLDVDQAGVPGNIRVVEAVPAGVFEQEAIRAVKKWKYVQGSPKKDHRVNIEFEISPVGQAEEIAQ